MKKKILSLFLALTLCLSLLPTAAFAEGDAQDLPEQGEEILVPEQPGEPEEEPVLEDEQEGLAGVSAPQTGAANSEIAVRATGGHSQYHTTICNTYGCTKHNALSWSAISSVDELTSATGEDKGYYLTTELELTEPWVPTGTVNLCLNGHSITLHAGTDAAPQSTIEVTSGVQLNIADCKAVVPGSKSDGVYYGGPYVQHADGRVGPGITVLNGGTVELFGGKITQNSDGVVVQDGGTLNMPSNSEVSGNTGAGVRVENGGTLNISGGKIGSNEGCGVDVAQGSTFNVSGGTEILRNTKNGETCNVYLHDSATVKVSKLSQAKIGVTVETLPTDGNFVPVTSDNQASRSDQNCITSDDTSYRVVYSTTNSPNNLVLNARPTPLHADHTKTTFVNSLSSSDGKLLINGEEAGKNSDTGSTYYVLPDGNYYLEDDLTLSNGLLAYSADVVLCLNGHNITVAGTNYVIYTAKKTSSASGSYTFTLTDCAEEPGTLTHSYNQYANGGVCVRDGTFIMRGGKISGNNSGVYVYQGNKFEIYGGEISGNKSYGVSLTPDSKSYIYMTVGGTAKIMGNWENGTYDAENHLYEQGTAGTAKNVLFTAKPYKYITVDPSLTTGAEIGVTIWKEVTAERGYVAVATYGTANTADATPYVQYFKSDSDAYKVWSVDNNVVIGVRNSEDQTHPVCGAVCNHKGTNGNPLHQNIVWTPVSDELGLNNNGDNLYLTQDIELSRTWEISNGSTVNLCLNGHTITANGDFDAITLTSNTNTLNICDCNASGAGKGIITHAEGMTGSGVYMTAADGRKATVNMYGGTITGNTGHTVTVKNGVSTRGGGVYVDSNAQFFMRGGSITENTADVGGGVYYTASNSLFVSGKVNITGNKDTDDNNNNVYVPSSIGTPKTVPFYIGQDGLAEEARIGVRVNDGVIGTGERSPVAQFAPQANMTSAYREGNFIPDNGGVYGFKMEAREHDTLTSTHVVNLYNGLPHQHPICGETCTHTGSDVHTDVIWTLLTSDANGKPSAGGTELTIGQFNQTQGYVLSAGHYYLSDALNLDKPLLIKNGVYLCLNGQTLTVSSSNSAVIIDQNGDLTLCDCSEEQPGKITHAAGVTGRGVYMGASKGRDDSYNGSFTMYGGSITGNHIAANSGAGVYMRYGTFNMHGGSITGNTTAENHGTGGVYVSGGEFNMTGGRITDTGGGVRVDSQGTFNMSGNAVISNNNAYYGGVYVYAATFNMSGNASVSGNTANYGGGVYVGADTASAAAKFNMSGNASISGNIANYGGGVHVGGSSSFTMSEKAAITGNNVNSDGGGVYVKGYTATMTVSGDVQIKDNWQDGSKNDKTGVYEKGDNSSANNFYLFGEDKTKQQTITIGGVLDTTARIGVTTRLTPTASNPIKIATGATGAQIHYARVFTPDVTGRGYTITLPVGGQNLYLSTHQHVWSYTAEGATITAACTDTTCTSKNGGSVTIVAPDKNTLTYDGNTKEAMLEGALTTGETLTANDIKYYHKIGEQEYQLETGAKPTNAKSYRAEITVGGVNASVTYEINKATPQASDFLFSGPNDRTYDGNPKTATVTSTKIDADHIKVKYYQGETVVERPTEAGTYTVKIDVEESGNYNAARDLTNGWTFEIAKNTNTPDVTLSGEMVYKREKIEPTATVKIGNATLVKDQDYTVTYGTNFDAGTNTGVVYIEAKGNYGFTEVIKYFNIAKKTITVTAENKSSRVGQALEKLTYTCDPQPYEGDTFSGELATNANKDTAGTYDITQDTLTLGDNYNIDFKPGTYTVNVKDEQTNFNFAGVENGKVTKVYGADTEFTLAATGAATGSTVTYESTDTNVATVDGTGKVTIKGAGTAVIKATASATDDYAEATAQYTLTVSPKTLTKDDLEFTSDSTFSKVYDGNATCTTATVQITDTAKVNITDTLPTVNGTYAYNSPNVQKANAVIFTSEKSDNTNYTLPAGLTVTQNASITPADQAELTIASAATTPYGTDLTLTVSGGSGNGAVTYTVTDDTGKATVSGSTLHPVQAGTVTVVATKAGDGNYNSISSAAKEITIDKVTYNGPKSDQTIPIVKNRTDAQTGTLTAVDFFPAGQAPAGAVITHVTSGSGSLMSTVGLEDGELSYVSKSNISDAAGEAHTYTVTISTTNYENFTVELKFLLTNKESVTISGLTYTDKTYDGQPIAPTGALVVSGDKVPVNELVVLYSGTGTTNYQSADAPKNAGTYQVTYSIAESNESCIGSASYSFTIAPKPVTVAPKSISITKGDALPTFELVCNGLVQGDTLTPSVQPAFTCFESDGTTAVTANTAAGTYAITWTNADGTTFSDANYTVTKEAAGTLTITARGSSGGGGGSSVTTYPVNTPSKTQSGSVTSTPKNASKGDTVTITVKPDSGFVLDGLTVTDRNGNVLKLTDQGGGKYTFIMPASKVEVNAAFVPETVSSPFADVSSDSYYAQPVQWAADQGITSGVSKDSFGPDLSCTRAQIITFLWRAAGSPGPKTMSGFSDVSADSYYAKAVAWAVERGITSGTGDGMFSPDATCNRAQSVTFLFRAIGKIVDSKAEFGDVLTDSYYANAVAWAVENGITNGIGDGLFGPDNSCTRAQIITFLFRAYQGK